MQGSLLTFRASSAVVGMPEAAGARQTAAAGMRGGGAREVTMLSN